MSERRISNIFLAPESWIDRWAAVYWMVEELLGLRQAPEFSELALEEAEELQRLLWIKYSGDRMADLFQRLDAQGWAWTDLLDGVNRWIVDRVQYLADQLESVPRGMAAAEPPPVEHMEKIQDLLKRIAEDMLVFTTYQFAFLVDCVQTHRHFRFRRQNPDPPRDLETLPDVGAYLRRQIELIVDPEATYTVQDYVLRHTLNQITEDVLLLKEIWTQYTQPLDSPALDRLMQANVLALDAWSVLSEFLPHTGTAITYFRRAANIRMIPYTPVAFIGLPPTAIAHDEDYLATAHEFGHFLYWRGVDSQEQKPLRTRLDDILDDILDDALEEWAVEWKEEIFADVVGCLIGGPVVALSLQDMLLEKAGGLLLEYDDHYPIPAVRPFATLKVLEAVGWAQGWTLLKKRWASVLDLRMGKSGQSLDELLAGTEAYRLSSATEPPTVESMALLDAKTQIETIAHSVLSLFPEDWLASRREAAWTGSPETMEDVRALYQAFANGRPLPGGEPLAIPNAQSLQNEHWRTLVARQLYSDTFELVTEQVNASWIREILAAASAQARAGVPSTPASDEEKHPLTRRELFAVLRFGGWGDAGPSGGPPHFS